GEHELLGVDWLRLERPGACLAERGFEHIAQFGDFWGDDLKSLRNLVHQLHSLDVVTEAALSWAPDIVGICRPDLRYLDPFDQWRAEAAETLEPTVFVPDWQHWGGYNDRFAVCSSPTAAGAWGKRVESALDYVKSTGRPLHSERLLAWRLKRSG